MPDPAQSGLAGHLRVLLVEDDADHRMIAEHYLGKVEDPSSEVLHADSLAGARTLLAAGGVDVLLLDLTLPDSSLEDTLMAIGELSESCPHVVAMSALDVEDVSSRAIENGAASFLAKQSMNAEVLRSILVQAGTGTPRNEPEAVPIRPLRTGQVAATPSPEEDPQKLASRWAHDALGWAANVTFRASALGADPAIASSPSLAGHVASLRASAEALSSFITGARALVNTEFACTAEPNEALELAPWLEATAARWMKSNRAGLGVRVELSSVVQLPGEPGKKLLGQVAATLLQNAVRHRGADPTGPGEVTFREVPGDGARVVFECVDDGGPWALDGSAEPGSPMGRGEKGSPNAGLGLYVARRAMGALGGSLAVVPRTDSPGAFAVRISLRAP